MITNKLNLPQPIVDGIIKGRDEYAASYDGKSADISATTLIAPPQIRVLKMLHSEEISQDASDMLWAYFGTAIHGYLEYNSGDSISEKRLYWTDLQTDMRLAGQFDLLENSILFDYKLTSVWATMTGVKTEWEQQLNVLAFLCYHNNLKVDGLKIIAMYRDWSATKAKFDSQYPQHQINPMDVKLWTTLEQAKYVSDRLILHHRAEHHGEIPECTDEERWASPAKWAVMKGGRKSAVRLLDSEEDANAYMEAITAKGAYAVVERPKEYKRCQEYCSVLPWCVQAKDIYESKKEVVDGTDS